MCLSLGGVGMLTGSGLHPAPSYTFKPQQHFSAMTEVSRQGSAQTAPLLTPEHGGWVSVNILQQHTLLVLWHGGTYLAI